jgi:hypothetical protein
MSKTAQRKRQTFEEGLRDAVNGNGFRYVSHFYMEQYRAGYLEGLKRVVHKQRRDREQGRLNRPHNRLLAWLAGKVAA